MNPLVAANAKSLKNVATFRSEFLWEATGGRAFRWRCSDSLDRCSPVLSFRGSGNCPERLCSHPWPQGAVLGGGGGGRWPSLRFSGGTSSDDRMGRRVDSVQLEAWFWDCGSLGRTARSSEAILGPSPNPSH